MNVGRVVDGRLLVPEGVDRHGAILEQEGGQRIPWRAVPTRIDIELTSVSGDGSWTWRAAGAREPKGVLDGSILPVGVGVGDQLRAESEKDVEGIRILSIVPPKQKAGRSDVLELLPSSDFEPVTQQRVGRDRHDPSRPRQRRSRDDRGDRGTRDDRDGDRGRGDRGRRSDDRGDGRGPRRDDAPAGDDRGPSRQRQHRPHFTPPPELPQRPKPKRLRPGKQHLTDVLASLPEEQRPVAELALQGMAAVRQRLREENARSKAAGKPEMPEATVLKMAEDLLPQLRVADWRDRADAAQRQLAHLDLRDLRSVVAASDDPLVVRDETTRALAVELKSALAVKQEEELNLWLGDVEAAVDVGRVVRALRLSAMPPKAGVPFPAPLGAKLGQATIAALTTDDPPDRWIAVLEAAAFSPIRASVTPQAAPANPSPELIATVTRLGPLLPQIASLFSVEVPDKAPAPKPLRPTPRKKESARKAAAPAKPAKRAAAVAEPAAAAEQPAVPEPEPAVSEQPAEEHAADAEPGAAAEQPAVPEPEPAVSEHPAEEHAADAEPAAAAEQPAVPEPEPAVSEHPAEERAADAEPAAAAEQPAVPEPEPAVSEHPAEEHAAVAEPEGAVSEPVAADE